MTKTRNPLIRTTAALWAAAASCALIVPGARAGLADFEALQSANTNLVFQYKFEGADDSTRLADGSANAFSLQRAAGSGAYTTGDIQFLPGFDGTSQAYQPAYDPADRLNGAGLITSSAGVPLSSNVTVEAVVQFGNYAGSAATTYVLCGRPASGRAYFWRQSAGPVISSTFGSNNSDQPTVLSYVPGDWYYIALTATYDSGTGTTTVNWYGADLSASETTLQHYGMFDYSFSGDWTGTTSIGVGVFNNGTQEYMDGRLDNTALTGG
ncbi:MAG TPA: hypothetical protein VFV96_18695, partial [Verrucomicrobiae bacterium]|nr:hypothetical protein [Verrucomicrobiae bacterium]